MNEVIRNIKTRRSIRDFNNKKVSKQDVELLIKCALTAPSGANKQTWKMTAVLNQDVIVKIASVLGKQLGRENYNMYKPTALIIPSNEKGSNWGRDDNACACQNIALAGHSMGIGSVWINQFVDICDTKEVRELLTELNIPENHDVYGIMALGYSSTEPVGEVVKTGAFEIIE